PMTFSRLGRPANSGMESAVVAGGTLTGFVPSRFGAIFSPFFPPAESEAHATLPGQARRRSWLKKGVESRFWQGGCVRLVRGRFVGVFSSSEDGRWKAEGGKRIPVARPVAKGYRLPPSTKHHRQGILKGSTP